MEYEDSYIYALNNLVTFIVEKHGFDENIKAFHDAIKLLYRYQKLHPNNILISANLKDYLLNKSSEASL